jgi:hypothetical protein
MSEKTVNVLILAFEQDLSYEVVAGDNSVEEAKVWVEERETLSTKIEQMRWVFVDEDGPFTIGWHEPYLNVIFAIVPIKPGIFFVLHKVKEWVEAGYA